MGKTIRCNMTDWLVIRSLDCELFLRLEVCKDSWLATAGPRDRRLSDISTILHFHKGHKKRAKLVFSWEDKAPKVLSFKDWKWLLLLHFGSSARLWRPDNGQILWGYTVRHYFSYKYEWQKICRGQHTGPTASGTVCSGPENWPFPLAKTKSHFITISTNEALSNNYDTLPSFGLWYSRASSLDVISFIPRNSTLHHHPISKQSYFTTGNFQLFSVVQIKI